MKEILVLLAVLLLVSCGPAAKLRRAEKLIKQAEAAGASWMSDTVFIEKPVIVPEIRLDSIVVVKLGDTVTVEREKLQIKLIRLRGDTVFVEGKCLTDTIKVKVPVNVYRTITAKGWLRWWHLVISFIVGAILGRILLKLLI